MCKRKIPNIPISTLERLIDFTTYLENFDPAAEGEFICMHSLVKYLNRISIRNFSFPESIFGTAWKSEEVPHHNFAFLRPSELLLMVITRDAIDSDDDS